MLRYKYFIWLKCNPNFSGIINLQVQVGAMVKISSTGSVGMGASRPVAHGSDTDDHTRKVSKSL
jgi:hypothetical protein